MNRNSVGYKKYYMRPNQEGMVIYWKRGLQKELETTKEEVQLAGKTAMQIGEPRIRLPKEKEGYGALA